MNEMAAKKKWIKADAVVEPVQSAPAYSREYDNDAESMARSVKLTEQLTAMAHAHQKTSVSNRTIRNSFYGTKD